MLPRFYAPGAFASRPQDGMPAESAPGGHAAIALPRDEAHHAARVLRLREGDSLAVFDGAGAEWRARIVRMSKDSVEVALVEPLKTAPEPRVHLTLLQAVLKGEHMDAAVRDATMIGVAAIAPVITARTVANTAAASGPRARDRWARVAVASAKQCRRAVVPAIASAARLAEVLSGAPSSADCRIVLAEPATGEGSLALDAAGAAPARAMLAVGPEGGWTEAELEAFAAAGFLPVRLGALTLRAEAAALVAISMLRARWGDL